MNVELRKVQYFSEMHSHHSTTSLNFTSTLTEALVSSPLSDLPPVEPHNKQKLPLNGLTRTHRWFSPGSPWWRTAWRSRPSRGFWGAPAAEGPPRALAGWWCTPRPGTAGSSRCPPRSWCAPPSSSPSPVAARWTPRSEAGKRRRRCGRCRRLAASPSHQSVRSGRNRCPRCPSCLLRRTVAVWSAPSLL